MRVFVIRTSFIVSFSTLLILGALELTARLIYPEFSNHIHSFSQSLGHNFYMAKNLPVRISVPGIEPSFKPPLIIILGDSISHGYGMAYEDIYWVKLQRLLNLQLGDKAPTIVSLSYAGNSLDDSSLALRNFIQQYPDVVISKIIYQFNFNDIVPEAYGKAATHVTTAPVKQMTPVMPSVKVEPAQNLAALAAPAAIDHRSFSQKLIAWRYEYLNHSVLFRSSQHYAGKFARKTSGDCNTRGLDALGPYTWSYGSAPFLTESERLWSNFSNALGELRQVSAEAHANLSVLISPLLFDIDTYGKHSYYNYLNYDFTCSRIDPRSRLQNIAAKLDVPLYDPTQYIKTSFEARNKEGNFSAFFFTADENHLTPIGASLIGEYLYSTLVK